MNYGATNNGARSSLMNYDTEQQGPLGHAALSNVRPWLLDSKLETVMLLSVILNGTAAGIIMIFSNTILPALATLDADVGINIMNTINIIIVNPLFLLFFFGGLVSAYPVRVMWKEPDTYSTQARYLAVAATLFSFGEFFVTSAANVPRNNALLAVDPDSDDGVSYWEINFLKGWVFWNNVRCIFSIIAAVLSGLSLSFMRKPPSSQ